MALDVHSPDLVVAVIGAGVMGRGIARMLAQASVQVLLYDAHEPAAAALSELTDAWRTAVQKGRISLPTFDVWPLMDDETVDVMGGEFAVRGCEALASSVTFVTR